MRQIEIRDIDTMPIAGVTVVTERNFDPYVEGNFVWKATPLVASFSTPQVSGGILRATKRPPVFTEVETHVDDEAFYFVSGVALMAFADVDEGRVVEDSIQIARIRPDTQFIIAAGKAHFVPVAEGDETVTAVVVSPKMDAPRIPLAEPVAGV